MSWIHLEPLYTEPNIKYHLLSGCLFLKEKYVKKTNGQVRDVTASKQEIISKCIEGHAKDYDRGIWDQNVRLRIYFDVTIHKSPLFNACFEKYVHHPFFQWVRYDIPSMKVPTNQSFHSGLIGTIVRFHPLFVRSSNVIAVSIIDLDNKYKDNWRETIRKFIKSDYDIHYLSGLFIIPFYGCIIKGVTKEDDPSILWCGALSFTSKVVLPRSRWNNMLTHIQSNSMLGRIRFLDSFKVSIYNNTSEMFMEDFEYGLDEIILNDMIYYYINRKLVKAMVTMIKPQPHNLINFPRKKILEYLKWNDEKSDKMYYLYKALRVSSYAELESKVSSFKTPEQLFGFFKPKEVFDILWQLQIDRRVLYLIHEYDTEKVRKMSYMNEYLT